MPHLQPIELIATKILVIRGHRVMIDADLAELYGVPTKRLNEQVKRNPRRFPDDFMFQLTEAEKQEVVANCDHLNKLKFSSALPFAFTEHGAIQAANVLNSPQAAEVGVYVVRAFVRLRVLLASNKELAQRLSERFHAITLEPLGYFDSPTNLDRVDEGCSAISVPNQDDIRICPREHQARR